MEGMTWRNIPFEKLLKRAAGVFLAFVMLSAVLLLAGVPTHFVSRGPGGGGAFFGPEINPFNPDDLWVGSDMSDLFHSTDFGRNLGASITPPIAERHGRASRAGSRRSVRARSIPRMQTRCI